MSCVIYGSPLDKNIVEMCREGNGKLVTTKGVEAKGRKCNNNNNLLIGETSRASGSKMHNIYFRANWQYVAVSAL